MHKTGWLAMGNHIKCYKNASQYYFKIDKLSFHSHQKQFSSIYSTLDHQSCLVQNLLVQHFLQLAKMACMSIEINHFIQSQTTNERYYMQRK